MRSAVWTVRSVDEVFFASDTIIGIKKEKNNDYIKVKQEARSESDSSIRSKGLQILRGGYT